MRTGGRAGKLTELLLVFAALLTAAVPVLKLLIGARVRELERGLLAPLGVNTELCWALCGLLAVILLAWRWRRQNKSRSRIVTLVAVGFLLSGAILLIDRSFLSASSRLQRRAEALADSATRIHRETNLVRWAEGIVSALGVPDNGQTRVVPITMVPTQLLDLDRQRFFTALISKERMLNKTNDSPAVKIIWEAKEPYALVIFPDAAAKNWSHGGIQVNESIAVQE